MLLDSQHGHVLYNIMTEWPKQVKNITQAVAAAAALNKEIEESNIVLCKTVEDRIVEWTEGAWLDRKVEPHQPQAQGEQQASASVPPPTQTTQEDGVDLFLMTKRKLRRSSPRRQHLSRCLRSVARLLQSCSPSAGSSEHVCTS